MPVPPNSVTLTKLQAFLRRGKYDYDFVSSRVYAACYSDPDVMEKILAANPEDVPASVDSATESSDGELSDSDVEEYVSEEDDAEPPVFDGSKENPVLLEEDDEVEDVAKQTSSSKRKRPAADAEDNATKKSKSDEMVFCLNCGRLFDPAKNKDGACRYHPSETVLGELELNPTSDQIEDDDPSRQTWPNAFYWECCEENFENFEEDLSDKPCKTDRHRADEGEQTEYAGRWQRKKNHRRYYG